MKKKVVLVVSYLLILALGIAGTVAYFTDRDAAVNVFTVGDVDIELNEDFQQGIELMPGKEITKKVTVENVGGNDAWVWVTVAVPTALKDVIKADYNTAEWSEGEQGEMSYEGTPYTIFTRLYNDLLAPAATTVAAMTKVYLDPSVDMAPDGKLYTVVNGTTTDLKWKIEGNEFPEVLVAAYAIQAENFSNAAAGYAAYKGQWGNANNADYSQTEKVDTWDGTVDETWYDDTKTEFELKTAEQIAGLQELVDGGNTFEGKTIELTGNVDLSFVDANGEAVCFDPIGSYSNDKSFKGVFDGQGHTISNMKQDYGSLNISYYKGELGLGLFSCVENATVKNLIIDNASLSGYSSVCGIVAATSSNSTFENITITNSDAADYQYYAGGIVGWADGKHDFINCEIAASTTIAAQWGDFDNSTGGLIGGCDDTSDIVVKNCTVACRIDAYNDITSTYQWHAYRRCGMLIGNSCETATIDGKTVAVAPQLTCENVTVIYEDWANYTYCKFAGTSWPYVRVQAGVSNSAYSNPRYGHPTDANGNKVVDDNHVHNAGEDHQILRAFDQLYGGGQGVYGNPVHDGVTVIYNN